MPRCLHSRGVIFNRAKRFAHEAGCRRLTCPGCGPYRVRRISARFMRMRPDWFLTFSLPRGAWPTIENARLIQKGWENLLQALKRNFGLDVAGWVYDVGEPKPECVCDPSLQACLCGANGRQLHRHVLFRVNSPRNRFGYPPWIDFRKVQVHAADCGLGVAHLAIVRTARDAIRYVTRYLTSSLKEEIFDSRRELVHEDVRVIESDRRDQSFVGFEFLNEPPSNSNSTIWSKLKRKRISGVRRFACPEPDLLAEPGWEWRMSTVAEFALHETGEVINPSAQEYVWSPAPG